jgi:hypothetical protein
MYDQFQQNGKEETIAGMRALKGWFDAAYYLSTIRETAFGRDAEVERIGSTLDARAGADGNLTRKFRRVGIRVGYFGTYIRKMEEAGLMVADEVRELRESSRFDDAIYTNELLRQLFGQVAGESPNANINGITSSLITDNAAYLEALSTNAQ